MKNKLRLLVIEDSLGEARIFYEYLREASNGEIDISHKLKLNSGLESLKNEKFDLIVLDLNLSDSHGLETLIALKKEVSNIPVIIYSGESDLDTAIKALEYGAQDYIIKGRYEGETLYRVIRFVLERKKFEDKLLEYEKRFKVTFEQAAVGIAHCDLNGRFILVNNKLSKITGFSKEELFQKDFHDLIHPEDLHDEVGLSEILIDDCAEGYSSEKRCVHKNGSVIWVRVTFSAALSDDNKPEFLIVVFEDITAIKNMEARLLN